MIPSRLLSLLLALALAAAACAGDDTTPDADGEPDAEEEQPVAAEAEEGVTLRLLTHDSFDVSEGVLETFTEETGVEVEVVPAGDAGALVNQAVLTQGDPQGDVLFGVDTTFLSRALDAGLFVPYTSQHLDDVPDELVLDDAHRVTPIDVGDVCLNYDREWFDERDLAVPEDLAALTDEAYEGLLAVTNPATSSPGLALLLATIERFGEDGWVEFWEGLRANDVVVTDGWSEAYYDEFSGTGGGERPLVLSYASSPPSEVHFAEEELEEPPTGVIEASCFRQVEFAGILEGTEHENAAAALVDFMLSPTFQEDVPLSMFVFPANERAELPEVFAEHAVIPDDPLEMAPERIGEHREDWIETWTETVLR